MFVREELRHGYSGNLLEAEFSNTSSSYLYRFEAQSNDFIRQEGFQYSLNAWTGRWIACEVTDLDGGVLFFVRINSRLYPEASATTYFPCSRNGLSEQKSGIKFS